MTTRNMTHRMALALNRTFDAIASDVAAMEEGGVITAEIAREVTFDADRVRTYGGDEEAAEALYALPKDELDALLRAVFPDGEEWS